MTRRWPEPVGAQVRGSSSYWRPRVPAAACTMTSGQLTFHVTHARLAIVPNARW